MQTELSDWERYQGGSPESEAVLFERLAKDIMRVQAKVKRRAGALRLARTFHAKPLLAVDNARFEVAEDLDDALVVGYFRPGASYRTTVRLSNASGKHAADAERDLRGAALRIEVDAGEVHDLLMTNFPVSHARDAEQFVAFAKAMSGNRILGVLRLGFAVGPGEAVRMLRNVLEGSKRKVVSLALETFWSRGAMLWGEAGPVRYLIRPVADAASRPATAIESDPNYLRNEMAARLAAGDVAYEFCVQRFVDQQRTPIEDAAVEWSESVAPAIPVARLVIHGQDVFSAEADEVGRKVEQLAFNPWRTTDAFRPLGNINRARKAVYHASASHRAGERFLTDPPLRNRVATAATTALFKLVNRVLEWHKLPYPLSLLNLSLFRHELRQKNLIDTEPRDAPPSADPSPRRDPPEELRMRRTLDGTYNDLSSPGMGAVGAAFGRNLPPVYRRADILAPSPVRISRDLLYREHFIPATTLNVLAAAWIQFQVHDWVQHKHAPPGERDILVPMPNGETWRNHVDGPEEEHMRILGDLPRERDKAGREIFSNRVSHWWDGSEVYGTEHELAMKLRDGGSPRLRLDEAGYLPLDVDGAEVTGFSESWWLGLSAMHTLFAREHNVVCDELRREYANWSDDRVYHAARLVISALIAKIHTVEWTPAILATREIDVALNANWSGPPKDPLTQFALWLTDVHALQGIPDTVPDHHGIPYSLTEDFVTVYRMHPLLPDDYRFYDAAGGQFLEAYGFLDIQGRVTDDVMRDLGLANVLYSFGIAHPGAITLHNYPRALQEFRRDNGEVIDLSVVDLVRERTRGIPRYTKFREGLHRPPVKRWEDISADPESVRRLREIYGSIDDVDAMVGLLAETPPKGFGFSDTAFRIFILMATRRLQSDRFLNVDFRPEIYSPAGIDWVQSNTMTSILLRHFPDFASVLPRDQSAFAPWRSLIT